MKNRIWMLFMVLMLIACPGSKPVEGTVYTFYINLAPMAQINSAGSGRVDVSAVVGASSISINGYFSNLTSTATKIVLRGLNRTCHANLQLDGGQSGKAYGSCLGGITAAEIEQFDAGQFEGILHSTNFPAGELRGTTTR
jgi:hypothetical protein